MIESTDKVPRRTSADVLGEIETKLATIDGIAMSDAFRLGGLVREYGQTVAGEVSSEIMLPLLDAAMMSKREDRPW